MDAIEDDGQCKTKADIDKLLKKYDENYSSQVDALCNQLQFYTFNVSVPNVKYKHYWRAKDRKDRSLGDLTESLVIVLKQWNQIMTTGSLSELHDAPGNNIHAKDADVSSLRERLITEADEIKKRKHSGCTCMLQQKKWKSTSKKTNDTSLAKESGTVLKLQ